MSAAMEMESHAGITVEVIPGRGVGSSFVLGMALPATVQQLQRVQRAIRKVEVVYDEEDQLAHDYVLNLPTEGIQLHFEPVSQRLRLIEMVKFNRLTVVYAGRTLSSPSTPSTLLKVYKIFGPTTPGEYDAKKLEYCLRYQGVSFYFRIPPERRHDFATAVAMSKEEIPLEFADRESPMLSRMVVHRHTIDMKPLLPFPARNSLYWEPVRAIVGAGALFVRRRRAIVFGDGPQDVLDVLGLPESVHYKEHTPRPHEDDVAASTRAGGGQRSRDYFYNYFSRGFDVMFCGVTQRVSKLIFHANLPGHPNFNVHAKCNVTFEVVPRALQLLRLGTSGGDTQRRLTKEEITEAFAIRGTPWPECLAALRQEAEGGRNGEGTFSPQLSPALQPHSGPAGGIQASSSGEGGGHLHNTSATLSANVDLCSPCGVAGDDAMMDIEEPTSPTLRLANALPMDGTPVPSIKVPRCEGGAVLLPLDSKWGDVQGMLGDCGRPVVSSNFARDTPFPSTRIFAYSRVLFEVMRNDRIACVTLL